MRKQFVVILVLMGILGISIAIGLSPHSKAETSPIYVKAGAAGDGTSWANAYGNIQDALAEAEPGDQIWVAAGTYTPVRTGSAGARTDCFRMKRGVTLYGGFAGTEAVRSQRDCQTRKTVLSGEIGNPGTATDNCYHVFYHPDGIDLMNATIDGFTITGGNANGADDHGYGGGIYISNGSPSIINCTFYENHAIAKGGALYNKQSPVKVVNCVFYNNSAQSGAAVFNDNQSSSVLTNCTIYENRAAYGGGIANADYSLPVITNCILWANIGTSEGNQIYNQMSSPFMTYSNIQGGWSGPGNISGTPVFIDPENGDFHLLPASPGIDAGDNSATAISNTDFEGDQRIGNGTVDMGADEFFEATTCNLTLSTTGLGSVDPAVGDHVYNENQVVDIVATASPCWQFDQWTGQTDTIADVNDPTTTITMDNDYAITANFIRKKSTLTLTGGPGISLSPYEGIMTHDCGQTIQLDAVVTNCCYTFGGWMGDTQYLGNPPAQASNWVTMPESDIILYVQVDQALFPLIVNSTAGGSVSGASDGLPCQSLADIEAIPGTCYEFMYWTGDVEYLNAGSDMSINSVTIPCNTVELSASFEKTIHNLTTASTEGGDVTVPGEGTYLYDCGTIVAIVAEASPNYEFTGWSGDIATIAHPGSMSTTIVMDGNYTVTANFEPGTQPTCSLIISSGTDVEVIDPGEGTFDYPCGTSVPIAAGYTSSHSCYEFAGWSGDIATIADPGTMSTAISLDSDYTIEAGSVFTWCPWAYDGNENEKIEYGEMVHALMDYLTDGINFSQMVQVLMQYLITCSGRSAPAML